jgi:hypothetical protein
MPRATPWSAAPQVAPTDDDGNLHAEVVYLLDLMGDELGAIRVDAKVAFTGERLATQFEDNPLVFCLPMTVAVGRNHLSPPEECAILHVR